MDKRERLAQYVVKAQNGDQQALGELFGECYENIYYFALKTMKDADRAADITQETCMEIQNTIGHLKEPAAFMSWVKQITYHQCTRQFRKKQDVLVTENEDGSSLFDTLEEDNEDFIPAEALDKEDFRLTIMHMIDELPEVQRTAVMMYYFDEMSVKQIAEIQGVSENTVKSRLKYARDAIKTAVETYEDKHGIRLHSFGFAPFMVWMFGADKAACALSASAATTIAEGIGAATGVSVAAASASTATAAAAATVVGAKIGVIAAIVAGTAVALTGGIIAAMNLTAEEVPPTTTPVSTVLPAPAIDLFADIRVTFTGLDGEGVVTLSGDCSETEVSFAPDREEGLSNGDIVTVRATLADDTVAVEAMEKTFVVSGLDVYITDPDQLDATAIDRLETAFREKRDAEFQQRDTVTVADVRYLGSCLFGETDSRRNKLYTVYEITAEIDDFGRFRYYAYAAFENVLLRGDGTTTMDGQNGEELERYTTSGFYSTYGYGFKQNGVNVTGYRQCDELLDHICQEEYNAAYIDNVSGYGEVLTRADQLDAVSETATSRFMQRRREEYDAEDTVTITDTRYLGTCLLEEQSRAYMIFELTADVADYGRVRWYSYASFDQPAMYADGTISVAAQVGGEPATFETTVLNTTHGHGFRQGGVKFTGFLQYDDLLDVILSEDTTYNSNVSGYGELMTSLDQLTAAEKSTLTDEFTRRRQLPTSLNKGTVTDVTLVGSYLVDTTGDDDRPSSEEIEDVFRGYLFEYASDNALINVFAVTVETDNGETHTTYVYSKRENVLVYDDATTSMQNDGCTDAVVIDYSGIGGVFGTGFVKDGVVYDGFDTLASLHDYLMVYVNRYGMTYTTDLT